LLKASKDRLVAKLNLSQKRFAVQKLKPGGSLVFFYGKTQEPDVHRIFYNYKEELTYWCSICVKHAGISPHGTRLHTRDVIVDWKAMMWFVKSKKRAYMHDVHDFIQSEKPDKHAHPWAQSTVEAEYMIKNVTIGKDALVVDPFLGSGAFGVAAIKLGRYFVGIELDSSVYDRAVSYIKQETAAAQQENNLGQDSSKEQSVNSC
jgi:DNA modification methylase